MVLQAVTVQELFMSWAKWAINTTILKTGIVCVAPDSWALSVAPVTSPGSPSPFATKQIEVGLSSWPTIGQGQRMTFNPNLFFFYHLLKSKGASKCT